ncbi:uncharacterized protein HD556DRAFT_1438463 [Suillus plorans]|uniref:Uncharacterized protein n=1 Tax=Suillus plorans TaxID=116603 RepID=A0A9P7DRK5_9AGAM|nr:uncharacterized protein HD556DRAFT_1438463 [Suillus plorans]KAG1801435.1 hypothetical protein HD556DRAFT_1438463 [Suillus plorans]
MARPSLLTQFRLLQAPAAAPRGSSTPVAGLVNARENTPMTDLAADRRATTDNDIDSEHERKQLKQFATDACKAHGLPDNALDDFLNVKSVKEMFLNLMATLLTMQRAAKRSASQDFIASDDFKGIMKDRLRACLLSPNLTGYVLELADNVIAYAKKHPMTFKIPDGTFEDSEMSDMVTTFIKENLTAQWGSVKQKINHSLKTKANISVLAKSLASMGHEVTVAHWARFAFLRSTFVSFQTVVEQAKATSAAQDSAVAVVENRDSEVINSPEAPGPGPATSENEEPDGVTVADMIEKARNWVSTEYWEFVDLLLCDVRQEARAIGKTPLEREKIVET